MSDQLELQYVRLVFTESNEAQAVNDIIVFGTEDGDKWCAPHVICFFVCSILRLHYIFI